MISMGLRRLVVLTLMASAILPLGCSADAETAQSAKPLAISVRLDKDVYLLGEPIIVSVSLTNRSGSPVTEKWFSCDYTFGVALEDPSGWSSLPMNKLHADPSPMITDWVRSIAPGETVTTAFDLTRGDIIASSILFPKLAMSPKDGRIPGYMITPGAYRVHVIQVLDSQRAPDGDRIRLEGYYTFIVKNAEGRDREALELFESAFSTTRADADKTQKEALANYSRVWTQYRSTVFAPHALYYTARLLQHRGDLAGAGTRYSLLLKEFPGFPLRADALYYQTLTLRKANRRSEATEVGRVLRDNYLNHLVSPGVETKEKGSRIPLLLAEMGIVPGQKGERAQDP